MIRQLEQDVGLFNQFVTDAATAIAGHPGVPSGLTQSQREQSDLQVMARSQHIAAAVALKQLGYKVVARPSGVVVNQAILRKNNPIGDALFGVDNTFLTRALDAGIFEPYTPAAESSVNAGVYVVEPELLQEYAAALAQNLESSWELIADALREWTVADLATTYRFTNGGQAIALSRQWLTDSNGAAKRLDHNLFPIGSIGHELIATRD